MNYRHHFHAGNFADVVKHTVLLSLVRGMQRKEKGFLYLDTHAGRGLYELSRAARGLTLERAPEWPDGIGRVLAASISESPLAIRAYVEAVLTLQAQALSRPSDLSDGGKPGFSEAADAGRATIALYPGSPWLVYPQMRSQDRLVLCEQQEDEAQALAETFARRRRVRVEGGDGYAALRAHLPPKERRALILIDPPYEAANEFEQVLEGLRIVQQRLPQATVAIWFPLTERARAQAFLEALESLGLPPTWLAELSVVGDESPLRMKGCGLVVVNPPWQIDQEVEPALRWLRDVLERSPAADSQLRWLVPE